MVVGELGLFAELGEAVEVEQAERLDRPGLGEGAVVDGGEAGDRLAADLGDQVQRAGLCRLTAPARRAD